jgi:hypothetical protein
MLSWLDDGVTPERRQHTRLGDMIVVVACMLAALLLLLHHHAPVRHPASAPAVRTSQAATLHHSAHLG